MVQYGLISVDAVDYWIGEGMEILSVFVTHGGGPSDGVETDHGRRQCQTSG
jgi:hypothetical protein